MFASAILFVAALIGLIVLFVGLSKASTTAPLKTVLGRPFRTGTGLDVLVSTKKKSTSRKTARYKNDT